MSRPSRADAFELSDLIVDYDPDTLERRDVTLDTVLARLPSPASARRVARRRSPARPACSIAPASTPSSSAPTSSCSASTKSSASARRCAT